MGVDHTQDIVVGYRIPEDEIIAISLEDPTIEISMFDQWIDPEEAADKISSATGFSYIKNGNFYSGEDLYYIFYVEISEITPEIESARDRIIFGGSLSYKDVVAAQPQLEKLEQALKELNLPYEGPGVWNCVLIS